VVKIDEEMAVHGQLLAFKYKDKNSLFRDVIINE
jgi:hypothetical protein